MKVLHVIDTISRTSGGPARSCQGLVSALCAAGVDALLLSLKSGEKPWLNGVEKYFNGVTVEELLLKERPDLVHIHNIWRPELHRSAVACRRLGLPYVISPRGCLEPWALRHKWLKKRVARWLYQDRDLKRAAALHATAESEAEQFRKLGFKNPIIVSPNGVNVPIAWERGTVNEIPEKRRVLFVSRMHPKKGVLELVEAWGKVFSSAEQRFNDAGNEQWCCELVYTLNDDCERDYEDRVKTRVRELRLDGQFVFTGALDDNAKWEAYARADVFVLPTYSENFGIVVAEALWAGIPVITTKGTPWSELESSGCGWWIDVGVEPLAKALREAMSRNGNERREMGLRGHKLAAEKYTWAAVVKAIVCAYSEILKAPSTVSRSLM